MPWRVKADRLRSVGWLSRTPKAFQDAVIARSELIELSPRENVYHAGDEPGGIYGVLHGQIEFHLPAPDADRSLVHIASLGFWVGDMAAVRGHERRFSVAARNRCQLLRLSRPDLFRICAEEPAFWGCIAQLSAESLGLAVDVVGALRTRNTAIRTAKFLLILIEGALDRALVVDVPQADLAELTMLSRASANAALSALERKGWIKRHYASIEIINLPALARFAGSKT